MKRLILLIILVLWSASYSSAQQQKPINIALIADRAGGLNQSPLLSLLEVKLSQNENLQLLERTEIEALLEEQQLSAAGLLERENTIKIGQLLQADVFIILSMENQSKESGDLIRVRVAETAHGLRLLDKFQQLDESNFEEISEKIKEDIAAVMKKLSLPPGEAIPVGIVDIHRVQLGDQYKMLERTLPAILSARLGIETNIIMLEREDLKILLEETLLTEGEDSQFWSSTILIDGYLQPDNRGLKITLNIKDASGGTINTLNVPIEPNEPSVAAEKAATDIVQQILKTPPSVKWDLTAEAKQFYQQGQILYKNKRFEKALSPLETAYALQPENVYYTAALFLNEWYARFVRSSRFNYQETKLSFYSDLELASIVSDLVQQMSIDYEKDLLSMRDVLYTWGEPLGLDYKQISYFGSVASVSTEQVRQINRKSREIWLKFTREELQRNIDPTKPVELAWASSDIPEVVIANLKETFARFEGQDGGIRRGHSRTYQYWRSWLIPRYRTWHIQLLYPRVPSESGLEKTQLKGNEELFKKLWVEYLEENAETENPIAKFLSCATLCHVFTFDEFKNEEKSEYYRCKAIEIVANEIVCNRNLSNTLIKSIISDIKLTRYMNAYEFEKLLQPLIERNDVNSLALWDPGDPTGFSDRSQNSEYQQWTQHYLHVLDKIFSLFQSHQDNAEVKLAMISIENYQSRNKRLLSNSETESQTQYLPVSTLLSKNDWPQNNRIFSDEQHVILENDTLWFAFLSKEIRNINSDGTRIGEFKLSVAGIDLQNKELISTWQTQFSTTYSSLVQLPGFAVTEEAIYLPITCYGIVQFPGSLTQGKGIIENPRLFTVKNGLPSLYITSIAKEGGNIWLAYGDRDQESGLGIYDPQEELWQASFCSALHGEAPFNSGHPYKIYSIMPVSQNKLFFLVLDPGEYWKDDEVRNCDGLWQFEVDTGVTKYHCPFWNLDNSLQKYIKTEVQQNKLWIRNRYVFIEFDIMNETTNLLLGNPSLIHELRAQKETKLSNFEYELFIPDALEMKVLFGSEGIDLNTATIFNNRLWSKYGIDQIIIISRDQKLEEAEIIDNNILDGGPVSRFVSTPYGLIAIGEGTVGLIETE